MKTIYDVAERLNKDPNDAKGRKTLARMLGGYCALRLDDAGKILASETEAAIEYCEDSGDDAPKAITFAEWEKRSLKQREACPVSRRALLNGELRIERAHGLPAVSVNWGPISTALREVASYRADTQGYNDPAAAVAALSGPLSTEWTQAQRDWTDLVKLVEEGKATAQQRELVERVRARLVFMREPAEPPKPVTLGVGVVPNVSVNTAYPGVPVLIVYHQRDAKILEEIKVAASMLERQGLARFLLWEAPPGAVVRAWRAQQLCNARLVIPLLSSDAISDPSFNDAINVAIYQGARLFPVIVKATYLEGHPITRFRGRDLSSNDTVIDVVKGIREIVVSLPKT